MSMILQTFEKIDFCAGISRWRILTQMLIISSTVAFEALFIFVLIPFFGFFDQSSQGALDTSSLPSRVVREVFIFVGAPISTIGLAVCLVILACLRETMSTVNLYTSQMLFGKIEKGIKDQVVEVTLLADFISTSYLGNGRFMELCNICSRESAKVVQSVLQIFSVTLTLASYFIVLTFSSPAIAGIAITIAIFTVAGPNFTAKKAKVEGQKIVSIR